MSALLTRSPGVRLLRSRLPGPRSGMQSEAPTPPCWRSPWGHTCRSHQRVASGNRGSVWRGSGMPSENRGPDCLDTPWLLLRVPSHSSLSCRRPASSLTGAVKLTGPWPPPGRAPGSRTRAACACAHSARRGAWQGTTTGRAQTESPLTREAAAGLFPVRAPRRRGGLSARQLVPCSPCSLA